MTITPERAGVQKQEPSWFESRVHANILTELSSFQTIMQRGKNHLAKSWAGQKPANRITCVHMQVCISSVLSDRLAFSESDWNVLICPTESVSCPKRTNDCCPTKRTNPIRSSSHFYCSPFASNCFLTLYFQWRPDCCVFINFNCVSVSRPLSLSQIRTFRMTVRWTKKLTKMKMLKLVYKFFKIIFILLQIYTNLTLIHSVRDPSQSKQVENMINV